MVLAALTMGSLQATVARAEVDWSANMETIQIGGVGNVRFMDPNHGYASGSGGTWAALSFEVTGMEPQPDGSILATMVHDFVTAVGGWVRTEDQVVMQPIPDSPGIFSLAVTYNVFETGDGMEGFEGQHFNSRGFIDTNRSIASVRYYGTISRKLPVH
jgi:hypothetical protein